MNSQEEKLKIGDKNVLSSPDESSKGEIRYWKSVDSKETFLANSKEANQEFEPGDSEISGLQRREMLKLMGASIALAGTGVACRRPEEKILPYTHAPENVIPGNPNFFATARSTPLGSTGLLVESHENRPTKIEGNPQHPSSLGAASSQDQACVLELYDPDRSQSVMKKERANLTPSSWAHWDAFAGTHFASYGKSRGRGLAVVYPGHGNPTEDRILRQMKAKMPLMQVFAYDPLFEGNRKKGAELAFGKGARVLSNFVNAKIMLSLHADPFMSGPQALKNARDFAAGRNIESAQTAGSMNRLYVVEADHSVTGSNADHRLRVPAALGGDFLVALTKELSKDASFNLDTRITSQAASPNSKIDGKFVAALAKDLLKNRGKTAIVVGEMLAPWVHALGHALNQALSPSKVDVVKSDSSIADFEGYAGLQTLRNSLNGTSSFSTLVLINTNLAYAAPGALGLGEALKKAKTLIHLSTHVDESAKDADWHLPASHFLESWGDVTAWDGTKSIQQPLIAPLYDTRSSIEVLAQMNDGLLHKGHELVRETWQTGTAALTSKAWRVAVHDGVLGRSNYQAVVSSIDSASVAAEMSKAPKASVPSQEQVELVLDFDRRILDGRLSNVSWMQELPDPITKLTWDNALLVSPSLARKMNLQSRVYGRYYLADVLSVTANGVSIEAPAFVVPGLAEFSVVASLGFGRSAAGTIGNGIGYDAYPLLPADGARVVSGVQLKRTSRTMELATTQEQFAMNGDTVQETTTLSLNGRDPARVADVKTYSENPNFAPKKGIERFGNLTDKKGLPLQMTDEPWEYKGNKWGMVIDLTSCIGCNACVTACQSENNIPVVGKEEVKRARAMHWIRVDRYFTGDVNDPMAIAQPVPCMHCENAPCEPVCPVAATAHDKEGLNAMTYNRCIGTRYCGNNCPYKVRRFNYLDFSHSGNLYVSDENKRRNRTLSMQYNPDVSIRYRGVMEKCTYCVQRIQEAKIAATRNQEDPNALKDGAVTPACAQTCPTNAITFGNLNDESSRVAKLKKRDRNYDMLDELNVRPRTSYLAKLRNPNPELV